MKIANNDIKLALDGAHALSAEDLPFSTAMLLYDAIEILAPKAGAVERERVKLVQKHGTETPAGHEVKPGTPEWDAFQRDWIELVSTEQEVEGLPAISTADLGDLSKLKVKAQQMGALRRIGVLVLPPPPPAPGTRQARRKKAREAAKS